MPKAEIPPGYDPRQRPWYKEAAATDGPILTEPYISASRGTFIITAAAPVKDAAHGLGGVVGSDFDVSVLARMITEVAPGDGGYAYLVSGAGTILIHRGPRSSASPVGADRRSGFPASPPVGRWTRARRDGPSARSSRASQTCRRRSTGTSRFRSTTPPRSHPSRISRAELGHRNRDHAASAGRHRQPDDGRDCRTSPRPTCGSPSAHEPRRPRYRDRRGQAPRRRDRDGRAGGRGYQGRCGAEGT